MFLMRNEYDFVGKLAKHNRVAPQIPQYGGAVVFDFALAGAKSTLLK